MLSGDKSNDSELLTRAEAQRIAAGINLHVQIEAEKTRNSFYAALNEQNLKLLIGMAICLFIIILIMK